MTRSVALAALLILAACTDPTSPEHEQRRVLKAIYDSLGGEHWKNNTGWLTDAPLSDWHGITVNADGLVTHLDLTSNGARGTVPEETARLTSLVHLLFWDNEITGSIPPGLGALRQLEILDFDWNRMTGSIPPELGRLANLEKLYFAKNRLSGPPPPELGDLANLKVLHMDCNAGVEGEIPVEWTRLPLEEFHWNDTGLTAEHTRVVEWLRDIPDQTSGTDCDRNPA